METKGSESIDIKATPERAYNLLIDLSRVADVGPLFTSAQWLEGATGPHAGAHFTGRDATGADNECRVLRAMPGDDWAFKTDIASDARVTWRYAFDRTDDGCTVTVKWDGATPAADVAASLANLKRLAEQ